MFSFLSFIFFSSTKLENRRMAEQVLLGGGVGTSGRGKRRGRRKVIGR
jgi:hypothetical protein